MRFLKLPFSHFRLLALLVNSLLLVGCMKMTSDITLYANERWAGQLTLEIPPETIQMAGGPTAVQQRLEEEFAHAPFNQTGQLKWQQEDRADGTMVVTAQISGDGFEQLNRAFFDGQAKISAETVGGQRQITLTRNYFEPPLGSEVIKISGGQIITSNAARIEGSTAIWENPGQVEVTLTESSNFSAWSILGSIIACAGLGLAGLFVVGGVGAVGYWYWQRRTPG